MGKGKFALWATAKLPHPPLCDGTKKNYRDLDQGRDHKYDVTGTGTKTSFGPGLGPGAGKEPGARTKQPQLSHRTEIGTRTGTGTKIKAGLGPGPNNLKCKMFSFEIRIVPIWRSFYCTERFIRNWGLDHSVLQNNALNTFYHWCLKLLECFLLAKLQLARRHR